jgi:hypothetical protein
MRFSRAKLISSASFSLNTTDGNNQEARPYIWGLFFSGREAAQVRGGVETRSSEVVFLCIRTACRGGGGGRAAA